MEMIDKGLLLRSIDKTGLSNVELAERTDICRNTIYNLTVGRCSPSHPVMNNLANGLELTRDDFIAIFFPRVIFKNDSMY